MYSYKINSFIVVLISLCYTADVIGGISIDLSETTTRKQVHMWLYMWLSGLQTEALMHLTSPVCTSIWKMSAFVEMCIFI